jgi:ribonuclease VapC
MAVVLEEPEADRCKALLSNDPTLLISAATVAETLIVAGRRGVRDEIDRLLRSFPFQVINVTDESARRAAEAHEKWGRGARTAWLNYGDCFSYELAKSYSVPLLFVGDDFAKTDLQPA